MNEILTILADNPLLLQRTKDILLKQFDLKNLDSKKDNLSLGEDTKAILLGIQKVEAGFKEIESYKTPQKVPKLVNQAR